ncbi:MAG: hypothetical protein H0W42_03025 [Gemmatimonadaceae bacterium]|nr:hypothetical protein [Gemmatimonadaceae bacterium]
MTRLHTFGTGALLVLALILFSAVAEPLGQAPIVVGPGGGGGGGGTGDVTVVNSSPIGMNISEVGGAAVVTAVEECGHITTVSTNAVNCKNSSGAFYGIWAVNTTATTAYLRRYDAAGAPTCSSATGVKGAAIPIPANTVGPLVLIFPLPTTHTTGIAFCVTGGGTTTDNTSAVAGIYLGVFYK